MSMLSRRTVSEDNGKRRPRACPAGPPASRRPTSIWLNSDPFTFMCMTHMEICLPKGEVGTWCANHNGLDGKCPVNTHGGLLSESYVQG